MDSSTGTWQAIGALGQWAAAIGTILAVCVALKPYNKRLKITASPTFNKGNGSTDYGKRIIAVNTCSTYIAVERSYFSVGKIPMFVPPMEVKINEYPLLLAPGQRFSREYSRKAIAEALEKAKLGNMPLYYVYEESSGRIFRYRLSSDTHSYTNN